MFDRLPLSFDEADHRFACGWAVVIPLASEVQVHNDIRDKHETQCHLALLLYLLSAANPHSWINCLEQAATALAWLCNKPFWTPD